MNFVVIICSAFRPEVLHSTVETVLQQDKLPSQIVLCVAENCHVLEDTLSLDIRVKRVLSPVRGLTAQRNYALSVIAEESPEITVFLDDDVEMECAFFRKVLYLFENHECMRFGQILSCNVLWCSYWSFPCLDSNKAHILVRCTDTG